jgi:hypothetical protein
MEIGSRPRLFFRAYSVNLPGSAWGGHNGREHEIFSSQGLSMLKNHHKKSRRITLKKDHAAAFVSVSELQQACSIGQRTAQRWISTGCIPQIARQWVHLIFLGALPWHAWRGWRIDQTGLHTPTGRRLHLAQIEGLVWTHQLVSTQQRELDRLRRELAVARAEIDRRRPIAAGRRTKRPG